MERRVRERIRVREGIRTRIRVREGIRVRVIALMKDDVKNCEWGRDK